MNRRTPPARRFYIEGLGLQLLQSLGFRVSGAACFGLGLLRVLGGIIKAYTDHEGPGLGRLGIVAVFSHRSVWGSSFCSLSGFEFQGPHVLG